MIAREDENHPLGMMLSASVVCSDAGGLGYPGEVLVLSSLGEGDTDGRHSSRREGESSGFFVSGLLLLTMGEGLPPRKYPTDFPKGKSL